MGAPAARVSSSRSRADAMAIICPYCLRENSDLVLVCGWCSRDIAVPEALARERKDLIAKRDAAVAKLSRIRTEIASIRAKRKG